MGLCIKYRQPLDNDQTIDLYSIKKGFYKSDWSISDMYSYEVRRASILNSFGYNVFLNPDSDGYFYQSQTLDASIIENFSYISDCYGHMYTYGYTVDSNRIRIGFDILGKPLKVVSGDEEVALTFSPINTPSNVNKNGIIDFSIFPHTDYVEVLPVLHGPHFIIVNNFYLNMYNMIYHYDSTTDLGLLGSSGNQYVKAYRISGRFYRVPRWIELDTSSIKVCEKYPSTDYIEYEAINALHYINNGIIYVNIGSLKPDILWIKVSSITGKILKVNVNPFILFHAGQRNLLGSINIGIDKSSRKLLYKFVNERDVFGDEVVYNEDGQRVFTSDILWFSSWKFKTKSYNYKNIRRLNNG